MNYSSTEGTSRGANRKVRKLLGRAYLRENRISEALEVYLGILKDFPGDTDVLILLGNLYRLAGSPGIAECLYPQALVVDPGNGPAEKQTAQARAEGGREWESCDPLCGEAIQRLIERLQAKTTPEQVEAIRAAADTLERADSEDRQIGPDARPTDAEQLLPALVAMNIRQARAAGYPDLAQALQSLQINLARQFDDHWADDLLKDDIALNPGGDE